MPSRDKVDQLIQNFAEQLRAVIRDQLSFEVTAAAQPALGGVQAKPQSAKVNGAVCQRAGTKRGAGGKRSPACR